MVVECSLQRPWFRGGHFPCGLHRLTCHTPRRGSDVYRCSARCASLSPPLLHRAVIFSPTQFPLVISYSKHITYKFGQRIAGDKGRRCAMRTLTTMLIASGLLAAQAPNPTQQAATVQQGATE